MQSILFIYNEKIEIYTEPETKTEYLDMTKEDEEIASKGYIYGIRVYVDENTEYIVKFLKENTIINTFKLSYDSTNKKFKLEKIDIGGG
ncbi:MAG: hypothetical protein QXR39_09355 [Candidatus Methanomethylicia archaeon]